MVSTLTTLTRAAVTAALLFLIFAFQASDVQAQKKARGIIESVDIEAKTMVLDHKKGPLTLKWTEETEIDGGAENLKPGQWVRNILNDADGTIARIRRFPEKDINADGSSPASSSEASGKKIVISKKKYGRKGAKARKAWLKDFPEKEYDPNTKAYCDALWMRVHEESCPELILKEHKDVITLEQADKEGWRIGESGQSGRTRCCFQGYRRKYPEKEISEDAIGIVQIMKSGKPKWHLAGCHRFSVSPEHEVMTMKEAMNLPNNPYVCKHCIERGPSVTSVDPVKLKQMSPDGTDPVPFLNPLANVEAFMVRRYFFDYSPHYKAYRSTGDKGELDKLLKQARFFYNICTEYPSAAQTKASDPEHWNYVFPMAGWSRIILQLARKSPNLVSPQEIDEAEAFLKAIVATLKPVCEEGDLDPEMGVPQKLADDFRNRPYNRAANGIGTLATISVALQDLQAIRNHQQFQPTIDRYRKCVEEWVKNWKNMGCMYTEADGKTYFYYAYSGTGEKREDGLMTGAADDVGHYSHCVMGATLIWESTPELGVDDDFMTAIANAIYHNSTTKNGSIQAPSADKIKPLSRKPWKNKPKEKLYVFEAFRDGLIEGQNRHMSDSVKQEAAELAKNPNTHWGYFKALRQNRDLIHVGE